jgi:hypothetical protein
MIGEFIDLLGSSADGETLDIKPVIATLGASYRSMPSFGIERHLPCATPASSVSPHGGCARQHRHRVIVA